MNAFCSPNISSTQPIRSTFVQPQYGRGAYTSNGGQRNAKNNETVKYHQQEQAAANNPRGYFGTTSRTFFFFFPSYVPKSTKNIILTCAQKSSPNYLLGANSDMRSVVSLPRVVEYPCLATQKSLRNAQSLVVLSETGPEAERA